MMGLRIRCVCWRPHVLASVNERVEKLDDNLAEMACHLEEKFYPHLLTTIFGRRWLLTHGLKLVLVKCLNSSEYLTALEAAISHSIEKGMQDGLVAGIDHGRAGRSLVDIVAYNPSLEADFNSALQELREVDFRLLADLESYKDASIEDVINLLRLESPLADAPGMDSLQPDIEQLKVPIYRSKDQVVLGGLLCHLPLVFLIHVWSGLGQILQQNGRPFSVFGLLCLNPCPSKIWSVRSVLPSASLAPSVLQRPYPLPLLLPAPSLPFPLKTMRLYMRMVRKTLRGMFRGMLPQLNLRKRI
ncbi:hypothetical protein Tco_0786048 [Tanacetum coccineum]